MAPGGWGKQTAMAMRTSRPSETGRVVVGIGLAPNPPPAGTCAHAQRLGCAVLGWRVFGSQRRQQHQLLSAGAPVPHDRTCKNVTYNSSKACSNVSVGSSKACSCAVRYPASYCKWTYASWRLCAPRTTEGTRVRMSPDSFWLGLGEGQDYGWMQG